MNTFAVCSAIIGKTQFKISVIIYMNEKLDKFICKIKTVEKNYKFFLLQEILDIYYIN